MMLKDYELVVTREQILEHLSLILNRLENLHGLSGKIVGIVPILNGSWFFASDVMLLLPSICVIEPCKVNLYGNNRHINKDRLSNIDKYFTLKPNTNALSQCDIIFIIDDIVDSGYTLKNVKEYLKERVNCNILTLTLINITNSEIKVCEPDYYLFEGRAEDWYFGYGMDYENGLYRNLPFVARVVR